MGKMTRILSASAMGVLLAGCGIGGRGGSGSADPDPAPPAAPVTLEGLSIVPAEAILELGGKKTFLAKAVFSDGHKEPAGADWTNGDPNALQTDVVTGSQVTVTGVELRAVGVTLSASFRGFTAVARVKVLVWVAPDDPGPVYGVDMGTLKRYFQGAAAPDTVADVPPGSSLTWDEGARIAYSCGRNAAGMNELRRIELDSGTSEIVASGLPGGLTAMDRDGLGRIWIYNGANGEFFLHEPDSGTTSTLGVFKKQHIGMAIGPDGAPYSVPLVLGGGIYRNSMAAGTSKLWALAVSDYALMQISCGLTFSARGEAFHGDFKRPTIYKYADRNGDGDALDGVDADGDGLEDEGGPVAEASLFARLPFPTFGEDGENGENGVNEYLWGLAAVGHGVLINVVSPEYPAHAGIWWAVDRNDDDDALDDGEVTRYCPYYVKGPSASCLIAPK